MNEKTTTELRIDIVSDVVCPWCIIGYKQLEQALELTGVKAQIVWQPFELNPQMVDEGENLREHIAAKYGTSPEDSVVARERLKALGTELGFTFNYADDMRMYNTFKAHQLLHWASESGHQHALKIELFSAFFTNGRNVHDLEVLSEAAETVGLDGGEARAVLEDARYAQEVRQQEQFWTSQGIQGVPAVIFNQRHLLSGAQGVDNYASALRQLTGQQAA